MATSPGLGELLTTLRGSRDLPTADAARLRERVKDRSYAPGDFEPILEVLVSAGIDDGALLLAAAQGMERSAAQAAAERKGTELAAPLSEAAVRSIVELYERLPPASAAKSAWLSMLARGGSRLALEQFAELMVRQPPSLETDAVLSFVPLLQGATTVPDALFPRLLDAIVHPSVAAAVLDLANYLTRERKLARHPAAARVEQLAALLGQLVQRLAQLEENPASAGSAERLHRSVAEGLALVVPLCDALGLIGDEAVTGKLHQATTLSHRRIRTEAAAALARLNDEAGLEMLASMAAEPSVRSRALAYLAELGQIERADAKWREPAARAEGQLAVWLAEPTQFGMPPESIELVDRRVQHWPGYDEPVHCLLMRYEYRFGEKAVSGVGIVGPVTMAIAADLADLPPSDIYAIYASLSSEHPEIVDVSPASMSAEQQSAWRRLSERLQAEGYENSELVKLGLFFGEQQFVAAARRDGVPGVLVADEQATHWIPSIGRRPLGPDEAHALHKGRLLLKSFNERG